VMNRFHASTPSLTETPQSTERRPFFDSTFVTASRSHCCGNPTARIKPHSDSAIALLHETMSKLEPTTSSYKNEEG